MNISEITQRDKIVAHMALICLPEGCEETNRLSVQEIKKADLLGELAALC